MKKIAKTWNEFFKEEREKDYSIKLHKFLDGEYERYVCYPPRKNIFKAFELTPLDKVKVVIIGQDPYHEEGQAMGLSFSVPKGVRVPPSLVNIFKEIQDEYQTPMDFKNGDLTYLATQGVLLLNSILSVRAQRALSHNIEEYEEFFHAVLETLDKQFRPMVFLLWGGYARKLKKYLHNPDHLILECAHPSPLSANHGGWFKNNHFKLTNEYLRKNHLTEINWTKQK
ncbi:MAG: uracil-DNA glycosylase [Bacilli bacterium]|nr:uracil-DNA glycosylase [Bacilli bacterium]